MPTPMTFDEVIAAYKSLLLANPGKALQITGDNVAFLEHGDVFGAAIGINGTPEVDNAYDFDPRAFLSDFGHWDGESADQMHFNIEHPNFIALPAPEPVETEKLLSTLKLMAPSFIWTTQELGDYDQNADIWAPETIIVFANPEYDESVFCPDAYSTIYGDECQPSHWGLSDQIGRALRNHNRVYVAKFNESNSPYLVAKKAGE